MKGLEVWCGWPPTPHVSSQPGSRSPGRLRKVLPWTECDCLLKSLIFSTFILRGDRTNFSLLPAEGSIAKSMGDWPSCPFTLDYPRKVCERWDGKHWTYQASSWERNRGPVFQTCLDKSKQKPTSQDSAVILCLCLQSMNKNRISPAFNIALRMRNKPPSPCPSRHDFDMIEKKSFGIEFCI